MSKIRQPVIAASLVIQLRIGSLVSFDDQTIGKQPLNCSIQGSRSEFYLTRGVLGYFLHNPVAVQVAIG